MRRLKRFSTCRCADSVLVRAALTVGEVQGQTLDTENASLDRSPLAPATGNGSSATLYDVRGVITQRTLARTSSGGNQFGFFLQSRIGATDGDPLTSDGIFVFMGSFSTLIGGYAPVVGDEVVLRARVAEFFSFSQLTSASLLRIVDSEADVNTEVAVSDAVPPTDLAAAERYWERHEGARMRVRAGSATTSGRDVFPSTADSEIWLLDKDDPLLDRADPYARRVFRDPHPLDNQPTPLFDDGNGHRIMIAGLGVKAVAGDNTTLLPPARTFDTLTADAVGGLYFSFEKYGVQVESAAFAAGRRPVGQRSPRRRPTGSRSSRSSAFNVENLYDFRDDPFDGCDFARQHRLSRRQPAVRLRAGVSDAAYQDAPGAPTAAGRPRPMHSPDILLIQEAEDQDICSVSGGALACGDRGRRRRQAGHAPGAGAGHRGPRRSGATTPPTTATAPTTAASSRRSCTAPTGSRWRPRRHGGARRDAGRRLPCARAGLQRRRVRTPRRSTPTCPPTSTPPPASTAPTSTPAPRRWREFRVAAAAGRRPRRSTLWAVSNHFSSTPDARVGQRTEQAALRRRDRRRHRGRGARAPASSTAATSTSSRARTTRSPRRLRTPSDQLGAAVRRRACTTCGTTWSPTRRRPPTPTCSRGRPRRSTSCSSTSALYDDLVEMRAAHVNAGWPADFSGDGARGVSDHDPQLRRRTIPERAPDQRWSTTQSMQVVRASTSEGSMAGYMAMRSWLRPSLR